MGQLSDALRAASLQLEARFRAHRRELEAGGLARAFPQSWRFETEEEFAVLRLDADGHVTVASDAIEAPSVIVQWAHVRLIAALLSGRSNEVQRTSPPTIRFTSDAGRRAFSLLGTSLGL
jgi:hypothetical protein